MADQSDFANTPFTELLAKTFNDTKVPEASRVESTKRHNAPQDDDAEAQYFLEAMGRAPLPARNSETNFRMEDRAAFQKVRPRKSNKRSSPAASPMKEVEPPLFETREPEPVRPEDPFLLVMRDVKPLAGKGRAVAPPVVATSPSPLLGATMQDFMDGKLEFALSMTGEYLEGHVVGLDDITMNKLRAGQYSPEAHVDLHGLNALQAYQALLGFFRSAWYKGLRTVLVVPGRGRNSPDGVGILREKLQNWLTQEPFKRVVLAFCTALPADGGPGSVYVLLRKYRKKGKIYWERMPADPDLF